MKCAPLSITIGKHPININQSIQVHVIEKCNYAISASQTVSPPVDDEDDPYRLRAQQWKDID